MNVLLVEDDAAIGRVLVRGLSAEGYGVNWRQSGGGAREALASGTFGAAILDLGLPDVDGIALCETLRATGIATPVLMLTARATLHDKLQGFGAGADDYLAKPFEFAELVARLNVIARRHNAERGDILTLGSMRIDVPARAISIDAVPLEASRREFDLLVCLARAGGGVVTRDELLNHTWAHRSDVTQNTVDVYIGYVRQSLAAHPAGPQIVTVRGVGYRLVAQATDPAQR